MSPPPPSYSAVPSPEVSLRAFGASVVGPRPVNQDAFVVDAPRGLVAVADGVGGAPAGDVASRCVMGALSRAFREPLELMDRAQLGFVLAKRALLKKGTGACAGMATTMVMVAVQAHRVLVAHVGDSRAYRLRGRKLERLTLDHSMEAEMRRHGVRGPLPMGYYANTLTRCFGSSLDMQYPVELRELRHRPGDRFVLCTDGLWGAMSDDELGRIARWGTPERACQALLTHARNCRTQDDATVIVADVST